MSKVIPALFQFTISSVGMMLGNKIAVSAVYGGLPLPCSLVLIQVLCSILLNIVCCKTYPWKDMTPASIRGFAPISFLFCLMIYTSIRALLYATVSTVLILRNLATIITSIAEYYFRGVRLTRQLLACEILILLGAIMYGWNTSNFTPLGFFWVLANVTAQVMYGMLIKVRLDTHLSIKEMSKYQMSLHNNVLGLPQLLVLFFVEGEHVVLSQYLEKVTFTGGAAVAATCVIGFGISVSGFALQRLVSATTFLVINNLTKFLNIFLGMLLLKDKLSGVFDTAGCVIALGAGAFYSYLVMGDPASQNSPKRH